jgi:hypothetical protein
MSYDSVDLRIFTGNGRDEMELTGLVDGSNIIAVCDRINARLQARRSRGFQEICLDLSSKRLDAVCIGRILQCFSNNSVCVRSLRLGGNRLTDFDMRFGLGNFVESSSGRFLTEIDVSQNSIGDFGCVCLLQAVLANKRMNPDNRTMIVRLRDNLVHHPATILEAVPDVFRPLVFAPGISDRNESAVIHLAGMDQQRCPRARRDMLPQQLSVPLTRPISEAVEPDDDNW